MNALFFVGDVAFTATNVCLFVYAGHHWWNLAAAVFCGAMAVWMLAAEFGRRA